jgi:hypothetical protein
MFLSSAQDGCEWSAGCTNCFIPGEGDPSTNEQEAGWTSEPVRTQWWGEGIPAPARNQSLVIQLVAWPLYLLRFPRLHPLQYYIKLSFSSNSSNQTGLHIHCKSNADLRKLHATPTTKQKTPKISLSYIPNFSVNYHTEWAIFIPPRILA